MGLFVCDACDVVANTATDYFWRQQSLQFEVPPERRTFKCSQCLTGNWHGAFPREQYDPGRHAVKNR